MLGGDNVKDPAFLFYPSDFLVGVSDLTMEERGQYITLLCLQHSKGRLSEKNIKIAIGSVSPDVLAKFTKDEDGYYYNIRLEFEIEKRENYTESRRINGLKGGRPKKTETEEKPYAFENKTICKPYGKAYENHSENENINRNININRDVNSNHIQSLFNTFWDIYPKKIAKEYAYKCFIKIDNLESIFDTIIESIKRHKMWRGWSDARYIPHPSTFINQRRWEDELPDVEVSSFDVDEFFQAALERSNREYGVQKA